LQETGVPPWERERLPLLCCGERVAWVAGLGVDVAFACAPGEGGIAITVQRREERPPAVALALPREPG